MIFKRKLKTDSKDFKNKGRDLKVLQRCFIDENNMRNKKKIEEIERIE